MNKNNNNTIEYYGNLVNVQKYDLLKEFPKRVVYYDVDYIINYCKNIE